MLRREPALVLSPLHYNAAGFPNCFFYALQFHTGSWDDLAKVSAPSHPFSPMSPKEASSAAMTVPGPGSIATSLASYLYIG